MQKEFLEAGKIVNTHGVRGDLKIQPWCDSPDVLTDFDTLYLSPDQPLHVTRAGVHKGCVLLHAEGIDSLEAAEALRGKIVYLRREDLSLPDDLVLIQDILGFALYDERTQKTIGTLHDVLSNPGNDLYEIDRGEGRPYAYVPAMQPFLQRIDMEAGVIHIRTVEGLIEDED